MQPQLAQLARIIGERFQYSVKADKTKSPAVVPLRDDLLGAMRPAIVATFVTMALILLIACTNVAALMLGQVEGRSTELAVRAALGATRGRITQQLVVEALLLGMLAGAVGSLFAASGFRVLAHALPLGTWADSATFDWTLFAAALGIAIVAVLGVVLVPSISLRRADLRDALNRARTGGIQGRGGRLEHGLVIAEVALAMLIATGAALLVRSVANRYAIDPGIETSGLAVVDVLPSADLRTAQRRQTVSELLAALSALPGVKSTAATMRLPLRGAGNSFSIVVEGHEDRAASFTFFRVATDAYFSTMGIKLLSGRGFAPADRPDTAEISVVINRALAERYFPGENPIGRRIHQGFGAAQRIIGVVSNVAEGTLSAEPEPTRYYSLNQAPLLGSSMALVIRTTRPQDAAGDSRRGAQDGAARCARLRGRGRDDHGPHSRDGGGPGASGHVTPRAAVGARARAGRYRHVWRDLTLRHAQKARLGDPRRTRVAGDGRDDTHRSAGIWARGRRRGRRRDWRDDWGSVAFELPVRRKRARSDVVRGLRWAAVGNRRRGGVRPGVACRYRRSRPRPPRAMTTA